MLHSISTLAIVLHAAWATTAATAAAAAPVAIAAEVSTAATATADSTPVRGIDAIRALITAERYAEAESGARTVIDSLEAVVPQDSLRFGEALTLLVEALWRSGRSASPGAAELSERAVTVRERTLGPDHPEVASALHHRANLLKAAGAVDGLGRLYERILAIRLASLGPGHRDVARTYNDYGNLMQLVGSYAAAESLFRRSCAAYEQIGDSQRRNLGKVLNNLAVLYQLEGDYVRARQAQERSKSLFEQVLGPDHSNVGLACVNLASLLIRTGDLAEARVLLDRGLGIHERALGPDHADVAWTLRSFAVLNAKTGDVARARRQLERAVEIHQRSLGAMHTEVALDLMELARISEEGRRDSAAALYARAIAINERMLGSAHPRTALALAGLARMLAQDGDLESALSLEQRVLAIREEALGAAHPDIAASRFALARTEWALGRAPEAFRSALRAEEISREHLRLTLRTLPERQALAVVDESVHGVDLALSIFLEDSVAGSSVEIADALLRSRAVVLDEMMQRGRVTEAFADTGIASLGRELTAARDRLARLVVRDPADGPAGRYRNLVEHARREKEAAERALAEASLRFRAGEHERRAGLGEIRAALPAGSALLSFFAYHRWTQPERGDGNQRSAGVRVSMLSYVACVIRNDDPRPILIPIGAASVIDSLVSRWEREIASGMEVPAWQFREAEALYREAGRGLREAVWTPVAPALAGAERVFVVPDGALHLVHFATLPDTSGYLIERNPALHYLAAERHLISAPDARAVGTGLLAIGGPDFGTGRSTRARHGQSAAALPKRDPVRRRPCEDSAPAAFGPLPQAAAEARWVAEQWIGHWSGSEAPQRVDQSVACLVGTDATEEAFKRLAPGRRVLHVATHGYFPPRPCATDRPVPDPAAFGEAIPRAAPNGRPAIPGGLAFAGANRRDSGAAGAHDGILTPEEIAGLDLGAVEWTVLSACNTGIGDVHAGEGVFGLRRAFELARCRSLIMSLWPVPDDEARDWMRLLYAGKFARRLDTTAAVRGASLQLLHRQRAAHASTHPFLWAGFIAAGDWR